MKKLLAKKKGFTLVELLIVIIIIGILAGMMMLSSGSATDKAEATKIVSDLRNIKSACLMFYAENGVWPSQTNLETAHTNVSGDMTKVSDFLDQKPGTGYALDIDGGSIFASYEGSKLTDGVKTKLTTMADDAGLRETATSADTPYAGGDTVYMIVRK